MNRLSDNFGHIGDRWVLQGGRYAAPPINESKIFIDQGPADMGDRGCSDDRQPHTHQPYSSHSHSDGMAIET